MSRLMGTKQVVLVLFILMLCLGIGVNYAYANEPEAGTPGNTISSGSISWQNPLMAPTEQQRDKQYTILSTIEANGRAELKSAIEQEFTQRLPSFSIHYIGDTSNIKVLLYEVIDEILDADDYLKYSVGYYNAKYTYSPNEATIEFAVSYVNTREQEDYVEQQVLIILAQIITPEMSPLKKVKTINDYIVLNSQYSDTTNDPNINAHSAYALLKEGQGVCQGYALLTYKMLEQTGLPVHIISGSAGGGPHAWNLVQLNDNWYHLDVTWNDPLPNSPGQVNYNYFLRNNTISDDHSWDTPSYPAATDSSFAYFHVMRDASSQGDNIFFSHEADENYLYRSSIDGTGLQKLNENYSYYITVAGGWIYYSNYSYGGYLSKIRNNGTDDSVVVEEYAINTYVRDNILYYTYVQPDDTQIDRSITLDTYSIATRAEPAEGGTVSSAGTYLDGDTVSLTAIANKGYAFTKWTENGIEVSTDAKYTFTANSDRNLTAEFQILSADATLKSIQVNGNDLNGFSSTIETYNIELPYGTTAIPEVTAVATDTKASVLITPVTVLPGTTEIKVTAEDGVTIKTYELSFSLCSYQQVNYKVYINGNEVISDVGFYELNNVVLSPIRYIADSMGLESVWDGEKQQVTLSRDNNLLVMTVNSTRYTFNGSEHEFPVPPAIIAGRVMVPLQFTVEAFGGEITIDKDVEECFIATAAFGSKFTPAVTLLRHFRDDFLMTNSWGIAFVNFYYNNSPPIANYIAGNGFLKAAVRLLLTPIVIIVYALYHPIEGMAALFALSTLLVYWRRRKLAV